MDAVLPVCIVGAMNATTKHLYIDPPSIPAGMTVAEYRRRRAAERALKIRAPRRINSPAMTREA